MYPQSSCDFGNDTFVNQGTAASNGIRGCTMPSSFEHDFRQSILPPTMIGPQDITAAKNFKISTINPEAYVSKTENSGFQAIRLPKTDNLGCSNETRSMETGKSSTVVYGNNDPRLFEGVRGMWLNLDTIPLESKVKLSQIYNEDLRGYGKNYGTYADIKAGDVMYYIGEERKTPYYAPLFDKTSVVGVNLYKDPMGTVKVEYPRYEKQPDLLGNKCDNDGYSLSWMRDSQMQRDDIMTSQMAVRNQQRFESRYPNGK